MNLQTAIKREERTLEKELARIERKLRGVRAAAKALGHSADKTVTSTTRRVFSASARAKISKAAKKRWAKFRVQAKQAVA